MQARQDDRAQGWVSATLFVSGAYVAAFLLTFGLLMTIEERIAPQWANFTSLVFLPHGVRVLSAWLYRWRSVAFLMPGVAVGHLYLYGPTIDPGLAAGWAVGVTCAPLAFSLLARLGMDLRLSRARRTHWRDILLVGGVASIFNSAFTTIAYGNDLSTMSARFVGDVMGTALCLALLMAGVRLRDRLRWRR